MILCDKDIRKYCTVELFYRDFGPMLEPFSEAVSGNGIISYGLTSAGYDIRLAPEAMVFKNTYGWPIDPKRMSDPDYQRVIFDFVDGSTRDGKIYIPGNGYALVRSLEYIRIPRHLKARCTGKSTYARCFTGDTKVLLMDGSEESFSSMVETPKVKRWGYGIDVEMGRYEATELTAPRWIGKENVVAVTLDNGEVVTCTPDHEFLRHGGFYTEASDLREGDGVVPLYTKVFRSRRSVWIPKVKQWLPSYWLSDQWNIKYGKYGEQKGTHRHHVDGNKTNDNPTNIVRKEASAHIRDHNDEYYGNGFDSSEHGRKVKRALNALRSDPEWELAYREMQSKKMRDFWTEEQYKEARRLQNERSRASWTDERRIARGEKVRKLWGDPVHREKQSESRSRSWTEERRRKHSAFMLAFHKKRRGGNHTVVSVKSLKGKRDVFCLTSKDTGNFSLSSGIMVRNCGLIVNTTPLEPEWEGHLTIEVANSSPCVAVIYVDEGIAQLEFETLTDHPEISYRDKQGKYQSQRGVTPAKVIQ